MRAGVRGEHPIEIDGRDFGSKGAPLMHLPARRARHADRDGLQLEAPRDVTRDSRQRAVSLGRQQDVPCQVEQPRQLVAPLQRLLRPGARRRREPARDDADDEKRDQRNPVMRIRDGERADRRQKEVVEGKSRHHRRNRDGQIAERRDEQSDEQKCERDGRRVGDPGEPKRPATTTQSEQPDGHPNDSLAAHDPS